MRKIWIMTLMIISFIRTSSEDIRTRRKLRAVCVSRSWSVCFSVRMRARAYECVHMFVFMFVCMFEHMHIRLYDVCSLFSLNFVHMFVCVCLSTCVCVCTCVRRPANPSIAVTKKEGHCTVSCSPLHSCGMCRCERLCARACTWTNCEALFFAFCCKISKGTTQNVYAVLSCVIMLVCMCYVSLSARARRESYVLCLCV